MSNLALNLVASASRIPDRTASITDDSTMTDTELDAASARLATLRETVRYARKLPGESGILVEHNVGRFVADAEAIHSYEGTREMNTLIVRSIIGLSAFV